MSPITKTKKDKEILCNQKSNKGKALLYFEEGKEQKNEKK